MEEPATQLVVINPPFVRMKFIDVCPSAYYNSQLGVVLDVHDFGTLPKCNRSHAEGVGQMEIRGKIGGRADL